VDWASPLATIHQYPQETGNPASGYAPGAASAPGPERFGIGDNYEMDEEDEVTGDDDFPGFNSEHFADWSEADNTWNSLAEQNPADP